MLGCCLESLQEQKCLHQGCGLCCGFKCRSAVHPVPCCSWVISAQYDDASDAFIVRRDKEFWPECSLGTHPLGTVASMQKAASAVAGSFVNVALHRWSGSRLHVSTLYATIAALKNHGLLPVCVQIAEDSTLNAVVVMFRSTYGNKAGWCVA